MTTDILAQQTADLAVTKAQLRAAVKSVRLWMEADRRDRYREAERHLLKLIDALDIPEDGAPDGAGSEG
jgi:hypothetical protein